MGTIVIQKSRQQGSVAKATNIIIGRKASAVTKAEKKEKPKSLVGKTVLFRVGDQPVVGVVESERGTGLKMRLCLPNSSGVLVAEKEASTVIHRDHVQSIDAVALLDRDAKAFETRDPLENCKASREVKDGDVIVDYQDVTFEGYGSTFKDTTPEDRDGDYIMDGAFNNSIKRFRENPVMLTDHTRSVRNLMGHYEQISINDRGLAMKGVLTNSPHPDAVHTRYQIIEGSLKTLSIGGGFFYSDDYKGIEEIDLYETSLVVVPANPDANFQVRGLDQEFVEKAFKFHSKRFGGEVRLKMKS